MGIFDPNDPHLKEKAEIFEEVFGDFPIRTEVFTQEDMDELYEMEEELIKLTAEFLKEEIRKELEKHNG